MGEVPVSAFSKEELRLISEHMASLRPPGPRPLTADQLVKVNSVIEKAHHIIDTTRTMPERGELVFSWRVPRDLALTGNAYAGSRGWKKHKDRKRLDVLLNELLPAFPKSVLHGAERCRWVRGTRFSPRRVDECALDLIGCKLAIDALKRADVIHEDNDRFLVREAKQAVTKPGNTHVLLEVFEIDFEGVESTEPRDAVVDQDVRESGFFTKAIIGGR